MRKAFIQRVAEFFKEHAGEWVDGRTLETVGGRYAWRSRVSDCRTRLGMTIDNRQRHCKAADGTVYTVSEYRFMPFTPLGRDAGEIVDRPLFMRDDYQG